MKPVVIIPVRMKSTRLPNKPLADINGKPLIQWVYEEALKTGYPVICAIDDSEDLKKVVDGFGGKAIMTGNDHQSGTDRIAEAVEKLDDCIVVNIQGDEPFIQSEQIVLLKSCFTGNTEIATLIKKIDRSNALTIL